MPAPAAPALPDRTTSRDPLPSIRVLIVDDDEAFRALCRAYLQANTAVRYEVGEAATGEGASRRLAEEYDCLLVDYRLPDTSGTGLMKSLQLEHAEGGSPPMILLTAVGSEDVATEALHCGAADYLTKHRLSEASLHRAIWNAVERTQLQRSIQERNARLEEANEQLRRKNDQIQRFYHTISHEIKTPLTAAREFICLAADGVTGPVTKEQLEVLSYAVESCDQIAAHFNDLIESTRLDTGKLRLEKEPTHVEKIIRLSIASVRSIAQAKRVTLTEQLGRDLPILVVDASRIAQVVSNLLVNAVKFTEPGGRVTVASEFDAEQERVVVRVADTGCGIAPEHLSHIFERLYQVGESGESGEAGSGGLGLGLSIAKDIICLHGGAIDVRSVLGQGSEFFFSLPVDSAGTHGAYDSV